MQIVAKCQCLFCGNYWRILPWIIAGIIVIPMMLWGGGRYPLYVDIMVYVSLIVFSLWVGQALIFKIQDKHTPGRFTVEDEAEENK
jgi:hypothetical protein